VRKGGLALAAALALLALALLWLDARMKRAETVGYCPADAMWVAAAADFPALWNQIAQTDVARRLAGPEMLWRRDLDALFNVVTGKPLTPVQWRRWWGTRFLAAQSPAGRGFCVQPGVAMRLTDWAQHRLGKVSNEYGIRANQGVFYAWRDGCLIISTSRDYVVACLTGGRTVREAFAQPDEIGLRWFGPGEGVVRIRAQNGLPVTGSIQAAVSHRDTPLTLVEAWPDAPLVAVTTSRLADLRTAFAWVGEAGDHCPLFADLRRLASLLSRQWHRDRLPDGWDDAIGECAVALLDVDTTASLPVPEAAMIFRQEAPLPGAHPLSPLAAGAQPVPYEWNGQPGLVVPWLGEKMALCLGRDGPNWLVATQEPRMNALVGRLDAGRPVTADMSVEVNWRKAGACAEALIRQAAVAELIPRMDLDDAEAQLVPWARALGRLGRLHIEFRSQNDRLAFEGFLGEQVED